VRRRAAGAPLTTLRVLEEAPLKSKSVLACAVVWALLLALPAAAHARGPASLFVTKDDLKWIDVADAPGVKMAPLEGDPKRGPSHFLLKFPAGFVAGKHHHTAEHYGTVLSGNLIVTVEAGVKLLVPGAFFAFASQTKHATRCDPATECVVLIDARGKWDTVVYYQTARGRKP
jgi:quercetin dioxygenase-like cupin family protein